MKRTIAISFIALALMAGASGADDREASCSCGTPASFPVRWIIHHSSAPFQQGALDSFALWSKYLNSPFNPIVTDPGGVDQTSIGNGQSDIAFFDFTQLEGGTDALAGLAPSLPRGAFGAFNQCPIPSGQNCGTLSEADIWLAASFLTSDNSLGRIWSTDRPEYDNAHAEVSYQATATHEIGHTLGFHHNFRNLSVMNYYQDFAGQYITRADVLEARQHLPGKVLTVTDVATYPFRYDAAAQPTTPNTDDSVEASRGEDAVILASAFPTSVAPGGTLQVRDWTAENLSTSAPSNVRIRFYLSTDRTITTSDIALGGTVYSSFGTWSDSVNGGCPSGCTYTVPASTPAGQYFVGALVTSGSSDALDSITYNNSWSLPDPIRVGSSSGGSGNTLSLLNGRFSVTLNAKDPRSGKTGVGVPITEPGNNVFGYFSIPDLTGDPNNPEVFIKILDARAVNNKFWVFYGSLTDFQLTLSVRDNNTGAVKTYNRAGQSLCGGADTSAFHLPGDTIEFREMTAVPVDPPVVGDAPAAAPGTDSSALASRFPVKSTATCGVDALCLLNKHFLVVLAAADPRSGKQGTGKALAKNDLFGYFSIPDLTGDPNNPEVFVKMLDGRPVNGKYWIFIGGLTDFELLVRVYDLTTSPLQFKDLHRDGLSVCGGADTSIF